MFLTLIFNPFSFALETIRIALIESPPKSKKLSNTETFSMFKTSENTSASLTSISLVGYINSLLIPIGFGNAFLSSLPLIVNGISSIWVIKEGII